MTPRRALLIAPTYDSDLVEPLAGASELLEGLEALLGRFGGYDVKRLAGDLDERAMRAGLNGFFDSDGELFLYFYGHGMVRRPGTTVLCRSEAVPDDEGFPLSELLQLANASEAREVVAVIDCCHAGNVLAPGHELLRSQSAALLSRPGTALIASCLATQQSHVEEGETIARFSRLVLEGLEGAGRLPDGDTVSASSLFWFVNEQITQWGQDPVILAHQTGRRRCHILSHPEVDSTPAETEGSERRRFGLPFAPSISFVGREAEIEFLRAFLCGTDRPLSLSAAVEGLGGIGKTELALQLLHDPEVDAAFPSILWFDASAPLEPQWAYFARQAGIEAAALDPREAGPALVALLRESGRVLIVLDNAGDWQEVKSQVPTGVSVIVTTRSQAFGDSSFVHQELGTLSPEAAEDFLARMLPGASSAALNRIASRLGGHALALEIAGHYIRDQCSPEEYLEKLEALEGDDDTEMIASRTHYGRTLSQCLQISWDGLRSDAARELWQRASLFAPASAHRDLLRAVAVRESASRLVSRWQFESPEGNLLDLRTIAASDFSAAYQELRDVHVLARVEGHNGERWAMHRLVRDFARARLSPSDMTLHAAVLSEWLKDPPLPVEPEAPHIVSAILDLPRFGTVDSEVLGHRIHLRGWGESRPIFGEALIRHLGKDAAHPQAISLIFEGLADVNADVRVQAIRMMEELGPTPEVREALTQILDDPSASVRSRAAYSILTHGTWSSSAMLDYAMATSPRATGSVLKALGADGSDESRALLAQACGKLSGETRLEAAIQLGYCGGAEAAPVLLPALSEEPDPARYHLIRGALDKSRADPQELGAALEAVAWGEHPRQALSAALELAGNGSERAARRLLELARDLDGERFFEGEIARAVAAADPGLLTEAGGILRESTMGRVVQNLPEAQLRKAADRFRELGAVALAEHAEAGLEEAERKRAVEATKETRKRELAERFEKIQKGASEGEAGGDPPIADSWSNWATATEKAKKLTEAGTPTESPPAAWRRVFTAEMAKGVELATAQKRAKAARDEAADALGDEGARENG